MRPVEDNSWASLGKLCLEDCDRKKECCVQGATLKMGFTQPKMHMILFLTLNKKHPQLI